MVFTPNQNITRFPSLIGPLLTFQIIGLLSCATVPEHRLETPYQDSNLAAEKGYTESRGSRTPINYDSLAQDIRKETKALDPGAPSNVVSLEINQGVEKWIDYFTGKGREHFELYLARGARYRPLIKQTLAQYGVPEDLYYLAMIESGFSIKAKSIVGAQGVWQFMKPTAQRYQLIVNQDVDERMDVVRATESAAMYLRDLHNVFQSWHLAMAAYNAGESRIMGAIMRSGTRDFWKLAEQKALPRETMNYVPKFIAASLIGHNPQKYGFKNLSDDIEQFDIKAVNVPHGRSLKGIADVSGIRLHELQERNPHLRSNILPQTSTGLYTVYAPRSKAQLLEEHREEIVSLSIQKIKTRQTSVRSSSRQSRNNAINIATHTKYKVRRGDNLNILARKFNTNIQQIKKLNNLRKNSLQIGQVIKIPSRG